jgi:hypothetical protein
MLLVLYVNCIYMVANGCNGNKLLLPSIMLSHNPVLGLHEYVTLRSFLSHHNILEAETLPSTTCPVLYISHSKVEAGTAIYKRSRNRLK